MIELENVSKTFSGASNTIDACKNVNLSIGNGEIFGIIGYSGAGKSTLVRCINLLEVPTSGKVFFDGTELTALKAGQLREARKKIGMIFQHFNLMPSRTVAQNVAFPLAGSGLTKEQKKEKTESLLRLVDIPEKADAYPSQLSGGQKQRVAIARALANDPKVLLCDEATSALDPQATQSILKLIKKLNKTLGLTVVIITHEMAVIKDICDRVAVMDAGEVVELGSAYEVFSEPKMPITKDFVRTTSNVRKIDTLIREDSPMVRIKDGERIVKLTYHSTNVSEALISVASRRYSVDFNIVFGNVEIIQDCPVGSLAVIVSGKESDVTQALDYFTENGVTVEVIK